jgi:CheY-like chemotaxis protein
VRITILDTGIGMEPEMLARVFETFSQADNSLDRSRGGLGLGLALVKGMVELHQGEVGVTSPGPGRGTELTIHLPLSDGAPPLAPAPAPAPGTANPTNRILIIEDNPDAAESMRRLFVLTGHEVQVASAGPAGIAAARDFRPDVVLCDIGLPGGMDGYGVAETLRRDAELATVRLIALTGYGQEQDQKRSREAGFDAHLTKPVDFPELKRLLETLPALK